MPGVEYYAHPWEFGPRKAKEPLLTGDSIGAEEAYRLGMVSKIFARDELEDKTLEFARRIAEGPTMATRFPHPRTRPCVLGDGQREPVPGGHAARCAGLAHIECSETGPA